MNIDNLTQQELKKQLHYNPDTGLFTRLVTNSSRVKVGDICKNYSNGYIVFRVNSVLYKAHRLAWLYMTGNFPKYFIDHINGITNDNRFFNLRECNNAENAQNIKKPRINNKSGYLGVSWEKNNLKYVAKICIDGNRKRLGLYENAEDAHEAYLKAKRELHAFCTI